jgi:hypothetical protein
MNGSVFESSRVFKTRAEVQVAICLCYRSPLARLVPLAGRVGALHVRRYPLATYGWLTTT